jgi:N-methylhydantoinase A/oxoprolinase/acetone carboxylase beta subunit
MPSPDLRLGIDVGGTNTDAVIVDTEDRLVAKAKVPTTPDVTGGIETAIDAVLGDIDRARITHAMLGTTHATNAVLERRGLRRVGVLRLGGPATHAVRPLFGWPEDVRAVVSAGERIVDGGIEFDGRELSPLDREAVSRFAGELAGTAEAIAITSVFAPVSDEHERAAEELVRKELGDIPISLSSQIGSVGLLERENATVLNAALIDVARAVAGSIRGALEHRGLAPRTFFAQNDGTLMDLDYAIDFPILTIGSGPANSIRGAAYLTGRTDAIVIDVGGTSTDIGVLAHGFPRESSLGVEIGGIKTNFRMPDLVTIALGGGTILAGDAVGPASVGYRISEEALVFGGSTRTLTDAGVAAGRLTLGDPSPLEEIGPQLEAALERADAMMADAIDRVKTSREPVPLVAVGGGAPLVPADIAGVSEVLRPEDADVANAIGAAIASVSGEVDRIFHLGPGGRDAAIAEASDEATERAVMAGADRGGVAIVEIDEVPLAYLTSPAIRIRVKAAGPLAWDVTTSRGTSGGGA